ncbi:hypothetical protein [Aureimonas sp. AU4]|uniref:hypothetical protein n=1 Tax=Aureimonas sp. AU4 TaxID=1638163 RepID=UPI000785F47B|nr:hypothetical protein [Aureimonas sp. AU4]
MRRHAQWAFIAKLSGMAALTGGARAQSSIDAIALAVESYQDSKVWCEYHDVVWASLGQAEAELAKAYPKDWAVAQHLASSALLQYKASAQIAPGPSQAECDASANAIRYGLSQAISIVGPDPALLEELTRLQKGGRPRTTDEILQREEIAKGPNRAGPLDTSWELENVRLYFQARGGPALLQAQALLASYGTYHSKPDGRWGAATAEAFNQALQTYIAIGGRDDDWGVNRPEHTSRLLEWVGDAMFATANETEYPD